MADPLGRHAEDGAVPEDEMDICWAVEQGQRDYRTGATAPDYKAFLAAFDLVHTRYTQRMWNAYHNRKLPRGAKKQPGSASATAKPAQQQGEQTDSPERGQGTGARKSHRKPRLTFAEWNAKFNSSPEMRKTNPPEAIADAWR